MMIWRFKNLWIVLLFLAIFLVPVFSVAEYLETQCAAIAESGDGCGDMSDEKCRALLEECSAYYDEQSAKLAQDITKTSQQKSTLQSAVSKLKGKIQSLEASIKQSTVMVKDLNLQITDTQKTINNTSDQIISSTDQIAGILREIAKEDKKPAFVVLLEGDLSDFFSNLAYLESLNSKLSDLLDSTKNLKVYLEGQQEKMSDNVDQLQKTIALQSSQKVENEVNKKTQESYLKLTEAQYQEQLANKTEIENKKSKIQSMLFSLAGTDDTEAPSFGEAIEVAKSVGKLAGIRPAFLLAIISQESAIGKNVGRCYLTDPTTGNGKNVSGATAIRVMKPTRDVEPFLKINEALNKDYKTTPVSCWITAYVSGQAYGWGGAMGPAQFIPSTWMLYNSRIQTLLGKAPNPWAIKDAFTASAVYLSDLGATAQTDVKERCAACSYYAGSCRTSCYSSYSNSVMNRANCIQTFIDEGTMSTYCQNLIF